MEFWKNGVLNPLGIVCIPHTKGKALLARLYLKVKVYASNFLGVYNLQKNLMA